MLALLLAAAAQAAHPAAEPPRTLRPELAPLGFLVGACWRGRLPDGNVDVHCFESVYGGQHVRDRHEVTGGAEIYRGETLYSWDGAARALSYTYWNSLGGVSRGTVHALPDGGLDFGSESYTDAQGRRIAIATRWRRDGQAYEAASASPQAPRMNRRVRYERVPQLTDPPR